MAKQGKRSRRVSLIRIHNILGIEDVEIEPGNVTLISGGNAQGKTSVIEAIKAAVGGGYDASLVRNGAEEGSVVLVMDDEVEVEKTIRAGGGGTITAKHPDMGAVSRPQTWLSGIVDSLFNPASFLTSKNRAEELLEAIPIEISDTDRITIESLLDLVPAEDRQDVDFKQHALEVIADARQELYSERTQVNRIAREKKAGADEMADSLPDESMEASEVHDAISVIDQKKRELIDAMDEQRGEIEKRWSKMLAEAEGARRVANHEIDDEIRELEKKRFKVNEEAAQKREDLKDGREQEFTQVRDEEAPKLNALDAERASLTTKLEHAAAFANTKRIIERATREAEEASQAGAALSEAILQLDAMRTSVLDELPIDGVEIIDGEVHVDGVPFHRVNRAKQVEISIEVAKLRAGSFPLICVDELECLEQKTFDEFMKQLAKSGLQAIVTRVTEGPLSIETGGES